MLPNHDTRQESNLVGLFLITNRSAKAELAEQEIAQPFHGLRGYGDRSSVEWVAPRMYISFLRHCSGDARTE